MMQLNNNFFFIKLGLIFSIQNPIKLGNLFFWYKFSNRNFICYYFLIKHISYIYICCQTFLCIAKVSN